MFSSAGKPKVRLTSDSPALNGSVITFTAKLEYPPCQKEDSNGDLVWDNHCQDGMETEASGAAEAQPGQQNTISLPGSRAIDIATPLDRTSHFTFSPSFPHLGPANGQLNSGYVYNWTSWMEDYGFGKCPDVKRCNAFPDGKAFPQTNDWRRRSYVYVWHALGGDVTFFFFFFYIPFFITASQHCIM